MSGRGIGFCDKREKWKKKAMRCSRLLNLESGSTENKKRMDDSTQENQVNEHFGTENHPKENLDPAQSNLPEQRSGKQLREVGKE